MPPKAPSQPKPFLEVRVHKLEQRPGLTGVCAGYERQRWRCTQLAEHLIEWLPEFALSESELEALGPHNAVRLIAQAAKSIYTSGKFKSRGEVGEILLHAVLRQVFGTIPAVKKVFFKDSRNNTVKGFDAVHVVATEDQFQLWLGEVKVYTKIGQAIDEAIQELEAHTGRDYLRAEFTAILNKIDPAWPYKDKLSELMDKNTSLDEVFSCTCLPVLLGYDSVTIAAFKSVSQEFKAEFEKEVSAHHAVFSKKLHLHDFRVHLILFPMSSKSDLVESFDERLKACQKIA